MKTLYSKRGKFWIGSVYPTGFGDFHFPEAPIQAPEDANDFDRLISETFGSLKRMVDSKEEPKTESYATLEDIRELERRIGILERRFGKKTTSQQSDDMNAAVEYLISHIEDLEVIKKVSYRYEEMNLDFFVSVDEFSSDLLENISKIEIELSRKFPNLSIEIEPILCDEEVLEGSHIILVRR